MYNYHNRKKFIYSIFLILLLVIGIGYAYLTSNLSISGNTNVSTNSWNIHFENLNVSTGSISTSSPATINAAGDAITYTIDLNRPKEYYEFTVDVKNDGTLPGKVSISTLSGITTEASSIIDYSVSYTNGNPVNIGDILNAGAKKSIKVRVFYKDEIDPDDFPAIDLNLTLTYTLQYVQSEKDLLDTETLINKLKTENLSCFTKYTGQVTDQPGQTVTASNVYFNKCTDKRNIKFAGFCWQMIRTTETGGIKMIYNGEPDSNGECGSGRDNHKGIVQSSFTSQSINSSYLYGSSFTYDTTTSEFTLTDTETATWSDSTYENLIGKFTCKTTSDTCTTIYQINSYVSNTNAYLSYYTIADTNYAQIGTSSYNANSSSPAMVGYMFNKVYNYKYKSPGTNTYKYGSTFTYDTNTNTYTLSGTTQDISDWSSGYNTINNTHYTCWNTSGTCSTISYINYTSSSYAYYFDITGGKSVSDILEEMLSSNDVNRYNSSIKGITDAWYAQNLSSKTNMLEDTVYCNARNITNYGGWNPEGGSTTSGYSLQFKNYSVTTNLACPNETDQFAVSNNKAKLTYPVSLLEDEERNNIYPSSLMATGAYWWDLSPYYFYSDSASVRFVSAVGGNDVRGAYGSRPVVSLGDDATISEGDGSEASPWTINE